MSPEPAPIVPIRQEPKPLSADTMTKLVLDQDLAGFTDKQLMEYVLGMYERLGLDPVAGGFQLLKLQGKLKLYADKTLSAQLSSKHGVRTEILSQVTEHDMRIVTVRATARDGRSGDDVGVTPIKGLVGESMANALMKAVTKAKRRATLTCLGLGMLDESEVDSIRGAERVKHEATGGGVGGPVAQGASGEVPNRGGLPRLREPASPMDEREAREQGGFAEDIPIDPPSEDRVGPKKYAPPARGWWDEPFKEGSKHSWKQVAEFDPQVLVEIVVAAGKRCGKRPTEENDNGWTQDEISALRSMERFNVKPLEEARERARQAKQPDPVAEPEVVHEEAAPETNNPATWPDKWWLSWCMCGNEPEANWQQLVNEDPNFVRDFLRKQKAQQSDVEKWSVQAAKMLAAVRQFAPHLLQAK